MAYVSRGSFGHSSSSLDNFGHRAVGARPRMPPSDPRSNYYQIICYVCKEMAKSDEVHSLHYGGVVCLSCRAFFRRAHQKTRHPNFICKRGGRCEVTVANRRRCQKCRYERCLEAGMNPNAVLTEEEKVIRFRKTIQKKLLGSGQSGNNTEESILENQDSSPALDDNDLQNMSDDEAIGNLEQLEQNLDQQELPFHPNPKLDELLDLVSEACPFPESGSPIPQIAPTTLFQQTEQTSPKPQSGSGLLFPQMDAATPFQQTGQTSPKPQMGSRVLSPRMVPATPFLQMGQISPKSQMGCGLHNPQRVPETPFLQPEQISPKSQMGSGLHNPQITPIKHFHQTAQVSPKLQMGSGLPIPQVAPAQPFQKAGQISPKSQMGSGLHIPQISLTAPLSTTISNTGLKSPIHHIGNISLMDQMGDISPMHQLGNVSPLPQMGNISPMHQMGNISAMNQIGSELPLPQMDAFSPFQQMGNMSPPSQQGSNDYLSQQVNTEPQITTGPSIHDINAQMENWLSIQQINSVVSMQEMDTESSGQVSQPLSLNGSPPQDYEDILDESSSILTPICQSYKASICSDQVIEKLFEALACNVRVDKEEFLFYLKQLSEQFCKFAQLQRRFTVLCYPDQEVLLARNIPLFQQFCLSCVLPGFLSEDREQLVDLLSNSFHYLHQQRLMLIGRLFRSEADINYFGQLMENFKPFVRGESAQLRSFFAYAILFSWDESTKLYGLDALQEIESQNQELYSKLLPGNRNLDYWLSLLSKMSRFCSENIVLNDVGILDVSRNQKIVMPYSSHEEYWLMNQLKLLDDAHRSVNFGEEITNEFMMYTLEVPVSKHFMKGVFGVALERMWRTFKIHPEFEELSLNEQFDLMNINGPAGLALTVARYESNPTGTQQILESFGESEEASWSENYQPILNTKSKVKKITMKDVAKQMSVKLSDEQLAKFQWLTQEMKEAVSDPIIYRLLKLLALSRPTHSGTVQKVASLHSFYQFLIKRRITNLFKNNNGKGLNNGYIKIKDPDELYLKINSCMKNIDQLAEILIYIINTSK